MYQMYHMMIVYFLMVPEMYEHGAGAIGAGDPATTALL